MYPYTPHFYVMWDIPCIPHSPSRTQHYLTASLLRSHTKHPFPHQASLSPQGLVNALQIFRNCWGARYGTRLQHRLLKYSSTLPLIRHDKHHKCGSASRRGSTMEQLASALRNVFYQHPSGSSSSSAEICTATVTDRITMPLDIIAHTHQAVSSRFFK